MFRVGTTSRDLTVVFSLDELEPAEAFLVGGRPPGRRRVAVVTDDPALGPMALSLLAREHAREPDLRQQTEMRIRHCAPGARVQDFVDLTTQCTAGALTAAVDTLADDPGCDGVLVALRPCAEGRRRSMIRAVERACRDHPGLPVVVATTRHGRTPT